MVAAERALLAAPSVDLTGKLVAIAKSHKLTSAGLAGVVNDAFQRVGPGSRARPAVNQAVADAMTAVSKNGNAGLYQLFTDVSAVDTFTTEAWKNR